MKALREYRDFQQQKSKGKSLKLNLNLINNPPPIPLSQGPIWQPLYQVW